MKLPLVCLANLYAEPVTFVIPRGRADVLASLLCSGRHLSPNCILVYECVTCMRLSRVNSPCRCLCTPREKMGCISRCRACALGTVAFQQIWRRMRDAAAAATCVLENIDWGQIIYVIDKCRKCSSLAVGHHQTTL
jgi:hypothetical protein